MDGDRPVADGRDIFESGIQELLRQEGVELLPYQRSFIRQYLQHRDIKANHVGSQDEAAEARKMGDGVRSESGLRGKSAQMHICDEVSVFDKVTNAFAKEAALRFRQAGVKKVIGHSELTKEPDGSIKATITFSPDWLEELQNRTLEEFEDEIINGRPRDEEDIRKYGRFED